MRGGKKKAVVDAARNRRLILQYGITAAEYDKALRFQGGVCFICGRPPKTVRLNVDHRHSDGLTRGLLCGLSCNKGLAYFRDDPELLRRAAAYLEEPPMTRALGGARFGRVGRSTRKWTKRERREMIERQRRLLGG